MKYHRPGGLNRRNYFLSLEARSLRSSHLWQGWCDRTGLPNLWDLMPDDLRWGWCNNNRNKVHNKCNALQSSRNHPPAHPPATWVHGKIVLYGTGPWWPKGWGTAGLRNWSSSGDGGGGGRIGVWWALSLLVSLSFLLTYPHPSP